MSRTVSVLIAVLVLFVTGAGCVQEARPVPGVEKGAAKPAAEAPARIGWEAEWQQVLAAGKKEGVVVSYNIMTPAPREAVRQAMKDKYGIDVEYVVGKGTELLVKASAERRAGLYSGDVIQGGASTLLGFKEAGFLDPIDTALILPDIKDPKTWLDGKFPYLDKEHFFMSYGAQNQLNFVINTQLVQPGEITSFKDLLNPKWKGKIIMRDPTVTGSGNIVVNTVMWELMGEDYLRALARQEPVITRDPNIQIVSVAQGKYPISIAPETDLVTELKKAGAPVKEILATEGSARSATSRVLGVFSRPAHPNAARVFVNWLLSREGQSVIGPTLGSGSTRVDAPTDHIDPDRALKPGVRYVDGDSEESARLRAERAVIAKEIFGIR
ncbi:MAG: extracellular solute-binding protein [Chloroflexi bacterium]|nr:extracellular solute-binding protein [Chloroflexota bacterium]